jgi:hypothetical protein
MNPPSPKRPCRTRRSDKPAFAELPTETNGALIQFPSRSVTVSHGVTVMITGNYGQLRPKNGYKFNHLVIFCSHC